MPTGIYLIGKDENLVALEERRYDLEADLQQLLARYPDLLAGDQMDTATPRRWLLVRRELAIPDQQEGAGRWAVDHLFLDQDGVPTLVEVKRSTDTRIRREVVGQMLDYAANALAYWPVDNIRAHFEAECTIHGVDPDEKVSIFLGEGRDPEAFWEVVNTNLRAGRIRMLFVADEIPAELHRIVEFLNTQMSPAEVLAVEIKQFVGGEVRTLVPRVIGQVAGKISAKRETRQWDEPSFFEALRQKRGEGDVAVARKILEWARSQGLRVWWGAGKQDGSFYPVYDGPNGSHQLISLWSYGRIELLFERMQVQPPFDDLALRQEFARRLNKVPGIVVPPDGLGRRPTYPLSALSNEPQLEQFLQVLEWALAQMRHEPVSST